MLVPNKASMVNANKFLCQKEFVFCAKSYKTQLMKGKQSIDNIIQ